MAERDKVRFGDLSGGLKVAVVVSYIQLCFWVLGFVFLLFFFGLIMAAISATAG